MSKLGPYYEPIKGVGTKRGRSIFADSEIDGVPSTTELTKLQVFTRTSHDHYMAITT